MKKIFLCVLVLASSFTVLAQHDLRIQLLNKENKEPVIGATITIVPSNKVSVTDSNGIAVFTDLKAEKYTWTASHVTYGNTSGSALVIAGEKNQVVVELEHEEEEEEEVIIQSTRSSRTIQDIPTRVEFIAGEELDEKANMKPGDIRMVLTESTGIQTQQTSATSANASIRIQGLDGRYTQILKDGFPLYAGFSNGLGLLQTPPLDLKQFEVIKGSSSTLYGGGAIAGLVNLISKTPGDERELKFHIDGTSAGGLNTSGFYGQKFGKVGVTLFGSYNLNAPYDPADIGLTAIPEFKRITFNPKLFLYFNEHSSLNFSVNATLEDRTGGDIEYIKGNKPTGYFENNNTDRFSTQFSFEHRFGKNSHVTFKNSFNWFQRIITAGSYVFDGVQDASFTEATYALHDDKLEWVGGLNLVTDNFHEGTMSSPVLRDYEQSSFGAFIQNSWKINDRIHLESGLRGDQVKDYGFVFLPRISALFKFTSKLSSRIGGGMGYKPPTIFTEESERLLYKNVMPIDKDVNKLERSYGVNADINYKTKLADGEVDFSINQLFFYTRIADPLLLQPGAVVYYFVNVDGHIDSKGIETNARIGYKDFKLYLGYTYTQTYLHQGSAKAESFLTPKHRLNSVLLYEVHEKWKLGLEAYYFSEQQLSDGATGQSYWVTGFMAEKLWEKISLYINFENFLDARQTKFDTIYTGTIDNPVFRDIYAPLDGFVINGGIKLRL
jgi:outer membrane receptor for ferrienterochelin and colicin